VAEGVETEAQGQYLKSREANQVQGFLYCRPLPLEELDRWHEQWRHATLDRAAGAA
jgi:sensor c-di-GMP phosphodiesterase-like protein